MTSLYRKVLARDPSPEEIALALDYLKNGASELSLERYGPSERSLEQYAQVLLSTNEEIFWP